MCFMLFGRGNAQVCFTCNKVYSARFVGTLAILRRSPLFILPCSNLPFPLNFKFYSNPPFPSLSLTSFHVSLIRTRETHPSAAQNTTLVWLPLVVVGGWRVVVGGWRVARGKCVGEFV